MTKVCAKKYYYFLALFHSVLFSQKYIITGGDCVGKSTVINLLQEHGYQVVPEGFTQVYHELKDTAGFEHLWADLLTRERILIHRKVANEQSIDSSKVAFLDRCALESIFFAEFQYTPIQEDLLELAQAQEYSTLVFMLDSLPEELYEQTPIRIATREVARAMCAHLEKRYSERGFTVIHVPFGTPEERMNFILRRV